MEDKETIKLYQEIGLGRLLNIRVILDDKVIYEGKIEDAPKEVKKYKYSKVELGEPVIYYVNSTLKM